MFIKKNKIPTLLLISFIFYMFIGCDPVNMQEFDEIESGFNIVLDKVQISINEPISVTYAIDLDSKYYDYGSLYFDFDTTDFKIISTSSSHFEKIAGVRFEHDFNNSELKKSENTVTFTFTKSGEYIVDTSFCAIAKKSSNKSGSYNKKFVINVIE